MTFFRTIWWFLYFFGALAGMVPAMRKAQRLKAAGDEAAAPLIQKNVAGWAAALLRIAGRLYVDQRRLDQAVRETGT